MLVRKDQERWQKNNDLKEVLIRKERLFFVVADVSRGYFFSWEKVWIKI